MQKQARPLIIVGFGIQICVSGSFLGYQGFVGLELVWFGFTGNNNFGNGLMPWAYFFAGGSLGTKLDIKKLVNPKLLSSPKSVLQGFGIGISVSVGVTIFLVTANKMIGPDDYERNFSFWQGTAFGATVSKAWGSNISTYGVGVTWEFGFSKWSFSFGQKWFGAFAGASYYWGIPIGNNAAAFYNAAKNGKKS